MKSYVIWNNKGGVGKSTIVFNLASRYADLNPNKKVLVIDLCPQANSTMMFLGGGRVGENHLLNLQTSSNTVVGYIGEKINKVADEPVQPRDYKLQVHKYNQNLPENLWLISGDGNLELIAPAINYYANPPIDLSNAWKNVHYLIKNLINEITKNSDDWVVFIDTNPSFAIYTELAMVAATHLIVPFKADDSSRVAIKALFDLLYGSSELHPVYSKYTFAQKAKENEIVLPLCHLFIGIQFDQYEAAAKAFNAISDAVASDLYNIYKTNGCRFIPKGEIDSQPDFKMKFLRELRDFNSAGVVAANSGKLLHKLHDTKEHLVHEKPLGLSAKTINNSSDSVDVIVSLL